MVAFAKLDSTFLPCPCNTVTIVRVQPPPYSSGGVLYLQELVLLLVLEPTSLKKKKEHKKTNKKQNSFLIISIEKGLKNKLQLDLIEGLLSDFFFLVHVAVAANFVQIFLLIFSCNN